MSVQIKGSGTIGGIDEGLNVVGVTTLTGTGEYLLKLNKSDSSAVYAQFTNSTSGTSTTDGFRIGMDSNEDGLVWLREDGNVKFGSNNLERLRINSDGKVGINRTSPNHTLEVGGNVYLTSNTSNANEGSGLLFQAKTGGFNSTSCAAIKGLRTSDTSSYLVFETGGTVERLRIDSSGRLHIATGGSTTNVSGNADDIIIGNTSTSNETGISMFSTSTSGIRFNDASGTDAAIEYSHSARELRFNSAGNNRLQFGVNASNSPVFSFGTGHYSGDNNNHNQGDRVSVKVGGYLHLESATGAGHNTRAGLGYNCYFHSLESFYCGTKSPSSGDNRPAAYGMAYGNHYFYSDASNTAHSAQASLTMTKNMIIHRQGYVTKPNNPSFHVGNPNLAGSTSGNVWRCHANAIYSNVGSHYDNSNGRFTAPIAGQYFFFHWGMSQSSGQTCDVYSRKNGSRDQIGTSFNHPSGAQHDQFGCSYVRTLSAGDYVDVYTANGNVYNNSDGRHGGWGGWLIG